MKPLVEGKNITVIRQNKAILQNVSLEVSANDFITIIGPNGAGKSVLLKVLMDIIKPEEGTIHRKDGIKIGYVPQRLLPDIGIPISVRRFLSLRKKASNDELQEIANEAMIKDIMDKQIHVLSGGELQRVLLARALLGSPEILVLDEPAQNLDISGQLSFYKMLEHIYKNRKISILMVSHDLHLVMASTKKVVCLFHHICCSGEPNIITKDPEFIELFGHDMARMMAVYHHEHNHDHTHEDGHNHV